MDRGVIGDVIKNPAKGEIVGELIEGTSGVRICGEANGKSNTYGAPYTRHELAIKISRLS
jgi:hypothetical protein